MKKIIAWSLLVGMMLALMVGCEKRRNETELIETTSTTDHQENKQESVKESTEKQIETINPEQSEPKSTTAKETESAPEETEPAPEETEHSTEEEEGTAASVPAESSETNSDSYELPEEEL